MQDTDRFTPGGGFQTSPSVIAVTDEPRDATSLAVGFDLDMTLIDTVPGFGATLAALGEELGVDFEIDEVTSRLGPPLGDSLAVRRHAGRVVVVTGKFTPHAQLHVDHLGLDLDHLEGTVWGVGKAAVLKAEGVSVYVGDHVHDVEGALAAGALSVSVLTGGCTAAELQTAGTHVVLADLRDFPIWLDEHLAGAAAVQTRW